MLVLLTDECFDERRFDDLFDERRFEERFPPFLNGGAIMSLLRAKAFFPRAYFFFEIMRPASFFIRSPFVKPPDVW
jgi:hypothetical protein